MKAIRLRTEYLKDPMGIDITEPRLMWNCEDGKGQRAYQVICTDPDREDEILWDSGKTVSSHMQAVYQEDLSSRQRAEWKVRLWDQDDIPGEWSEKASFEMGLLSAGEWKASWITGDYKPNKKERYPADCFLKEFTLEKDVKKARLYITACGDYEASLDGEKVGDQFFTPGYTDYRKRIQYQVYDVTKMLHSGANSFSVTLTDGWYRGACGAYGLTYQYGLETKLLAQLEMTLSDGSVRTIVTDENWAWSNDGPVRFADHKDGEIFIASMEPSYSGKAKKTSHPVMPTSSNNVPVRAHEHLHPVIWDAPNGKKILDFGQNIAGIVAFKVQAKEGQKIFLTFGEMLDEEGNLTLKNIRPNAKNNTTPKQQIDYTCREGLNEYRMRFGVFGFQYGELDSEVEILPEQIESIAVYSDLEQTGFFECSNELLNKFFESTIWSSKSNHLDIPTDCPTRERHGWTGDAQIFYNTAAYLFDFAAFGEKYVRDMYDWQRKDGCLPHIVPDGGADSYMYTMNGSVGWSDAGIMIPYRMWKRYQDRSILERYYEGMKRYAKFMISRCGKIIGMQKPIFIGRYQKYLVNTGQSYGEWAEPADVMPFAMKDFVFPHPEESTAYTSYVLGLMKEIAEELHKDEDATLFRQYSEGCRKAYQALVEKKKFSLDTDRQAKLVRPLYFKLLNGIEAEKARKRLIRALENYGWRLGTGFLSTPLILDVLTDIDPEAAYRLLENEELPGWLSMPKNDATTIWENWEGTKTKTPASLNHYSKGAVLEWVFATMCGIRVKAENEFEIAPLPGGHLTYAKASYQSRFGLVRSEWEIKDGKTNFVIVIPAGCHAMIKLPDGTKEMVTAGEYHFMTD
ncbi:MAG: family 78 glycoside hydrolase catalytic domain [Firmicutes bacterium]|nr:family 78 glycoside hydrolase catalytic domain [Bacillota bacterium]